MATWFRLGSTEIVKFSIEKINSLADAHGNVVDMVNDWHEQH